MVRQVEARQITDETRAMAVELGSEFRLSVRKNERPEDFSKVLDALKFWGLDL